MIRHSVTAAALWIAFALPAQTANLVNPGFERVDGSGRLVGWQVHAGLDPNRYGPPEHKDSFDEIVPGPSKGGRAGSKLCAGFPSEGLWLGTIRDHLRPNGRDDISGREFGKAALSQTVTLDPGTYVFGAYLRTAGGDAYTASFSLGFNHGETATYSNDSATGITWTGPDLALKTSFDGKGFLIDRGEWHRYRTEPFTLGKRQRVTVWIRFNYANNNSMRTRWQVDDAFIERHRPPAQAQIADRQRSIGAPLRFPEHGRLTAYCGRDDDPYLADPGNSGLRNSIPHRMFQKGRRAAGDDSFSYEFPVPRDQAVTYVAFEHIGPCRVTFGDGVTREDRDAPDTQISSKEYTLTDRSLWRDGKLKLTFQCPTPEGELAVVWIDCGSSTRFRERLKHTVWDTVSVPWRVGLWDGFSGEFRGAERVCVIGQTDYSTLNPADMRIEWTQTVRPGHRYYLTLGYYKERPGDEPGVGRINIGDDDLVELIGHNQGEEILEFDITDYLVSGKNVVSVQADAIDFAALIEVAPGITDNRRLGLYLGGDELAENLTRVLHNSMFWVLDLHYYESGFLDASIPRGNWWQQYWPIDIAAAMRVMLYWGYAEQAENAAKLVAGVAWHGHESNRSGSSDNNGGNLLAMDMCEMLARSGFRQDLTDTLWPSVRAYCDQLVGEVEASPFGLIKGTNWENAGNREQGPCYSLTTNLMAAWALLKACDIAVKGNLPGNSAMWESTARRIRTEVLNRLVLREDVVSPTGWTFPRGTWAYGLLDDGSYMLKPLAGYLWAGKWGVGYYGFVDPDPELRALYDLTEDVALPLVGGPGGVVSGYASSYDGEPTLFSSAALSDKVDYMSAIAPHFKNQTDYQKDVGSRKGELSRWAYGTPGEIEDTNLVCVAEFLDWPRYVAGVDDILFNGAQLRIIPRLPTRWNECGVNGWQVQYLDAGKRAATTLDYGYELSANRAVMRVRSASPVKGVRLRLGPFGGGTRSLQASVDGAQARCVAESGGGKLWAWVTVDTSESWTTVEVRASGP